MPINVQMPKIGLTMTEGAIVEWKKQIGDKVEKGEPLFVFETEKVTYEVEAPASGILHSILHPVGSTVKISEVVAIIAEPGEEVRGVELKTIVGGDIGETEAGKSAPTLRDTRRVERAWGARVKASPIAKKLARLHNVDLSVIPVTGEPIRILKADVEAYLRSSQGHPSLPETPQKGEIHPLTGMRRIIASKMLRSKQEAAQAYMDNDLDASQIQALRKTLLPEVEKTRGVKVSITDIMMFVTSAAIGQHPIINTCWGEEGIIFYPHIHMGMAMMLDKGLIVPVIREIDKKTIPEIAAIRTDLTERGRKRRLTPAEMKGSTFTLSSMGMLGIQRFTAIINPPENAILAVGTITEKAAVLEGQVVIRPMMNVALTYDHRTIDGAEAAKFMYTLKRLVEDPYLIFASRTL